MDGQAQFETFTDQAGRYRWRLKGANGEKVCTSGESFYSAADARRGVATAKRLAPLAPVVHVPTLDEQANALLTAARRGLATPR